METASLPEIVLCLRKLSPRVGVDWRLVGHWFGIVFVANVSSGFLCVNGFSCFFWIVVFPRDDAAARMRGQ